MAALSFSYIILTALVHNIFYIYVPYNVKDAYVKLKTEDYSTTNNTWEKLYNDLIDKRTPVFKIFVPSATAAYSTLDYKVKFHFRDDSVGGTKEWQLPLQFEFISLIPTAAIVNIIVCVLLIIKLLYQFSKN